MGSCRCLHSIRRRGTCQSKDGANSERFDKECHSGAKVATHRGKEPLTKEKQRGLVASFGYRQWPISSLGDVALDAWSGPRKGYESLHDFSGSKVHIEAKSTRLNPPVVKINKIEQLDWRGNPVGTRSFSYN